MRFHGEDKGHNQPCTRLTVLPDVPSTRVHLPMREELQEDFDVCRKAIRSSLRV